MNGSVLRLWALVCSGLCWVLLAGCATQTQALLAGAPAGLPERAELVATPFFPQADKQCGPAAAATVLHALGIAVDPGVLSQAMFLPSRAGSLQTELLASVRRQGAVATQLPGTLESVLREVAAGHPVVVLQNLGFHWAPAWHYAVVVGYDLSAREVVLRSGTVQRQRLSLRTFEFTWARSQFWAFVATLPGDWPVTAGEGAVVRAALGLERQVPAAVARAVYASALQRWPGNLTLAMGQGNSHFAESDLRGAAAVFEAAARRHRSAAAWINLATTRLALQEPQRALQAAEEAEALGDPDWGPQASAVLEEARRAVARH